MEHFFNTVRGCMGHKISDFYIDAVQRAPDPAHFVEVGVYFGQSAAYLGVEIINSGKKIKLDLVDKWELIPPDAIDGGVRGELNALGISSEEFYQQAIRNLTPLRRIMTLIRLPSTDAAALYPDASLDMVFIDAAHDEFNVAQDVRAWLPKVKAGGVLAGDDFNYVGVKKGIERAGVSVKDFNNKVWFLKV